MDFNGITDRCEVVSVLVSVHCSGAPCPADAYGFSPSKPDCLSTHDLSVFAAILWLGCETWSVMTDL